MNSTSYTWTDTLGCEYGKQVCADGLHGFRYLKVCLAAYAGDSTYTSGYGEVAIDGIYLDYQGFFGSPDTYTGWFQCSDADLTQWWYDGVYTNDLATDIFLANDTEPRNAASPSLIGKLVLHDGAKRDRDPYVGDISVSGLTSFLSHDLAERVTNVIGDLADHQRSDGWIPPASMQVTFTVNRAPGCLFFARPADLVHSNDYTLALFDYPLHWVKCTYDLVMYTGASDFLNQYYPALVKTLDTFYPSMTNSATNLLNKPSSYGDYAFLPRSGQITYYNALYVLVLNQAAELADSLSKSDDAARWRARASTVAAALLATNWDASVGAFFDGGPCGSAAMCDTHAQDGNSISILAGVTNTSTSESALGYLATHMAQPYGNAFYDNGVLDGSFNSRVYAFLSYFEIAARFETSPDTLESAFDEIRRLYGWMATNDPGVTQWEGIGGGGQPYEGGFTSMAHGWSTGIVPLMSNYVLGVTPTGPGFSSWVVKPVMSAGGLTWAQGVVPTPEGPITVAWERTANVYALKVSAPAGTRGIVSLALGEASADSVTVDGRGVGTSADVEAGYVQLAHDGGTHAYTIAVAQ